MQCRIPNNFVYTMLNHRLKLCISLILIAGAASGANANDKSAPGTSAISAATHTSAGPRTSAATSTSAGPHTSSATKKNQKSPAVDELLQQAKSLLRTEQFEKAIDCYSRAIRIAPSAPLYVKRAETYEAIGNNIKALNDFSAAIKLEPNSNKDYYNSRAGVYDHLSKYDKALADYNKAISMGSIHYNDRARVYMHKNQYQHAIDDFTSEIKHCPKGNTLISTYRYRAEAFEWLGKSKLAANDRKKSEELVNQYYGQNVNAYPKLHTQERKN